MTSKERVLAAINYTEPDRVPLGEWGIDHDHVSRIIGHHTFWRNRKDMTLALWDNRRDEIVASLKNDCVELVEALGYDLVTVEMVTPQGYTEKDPPKQTGEGSWKDSRGNVYKYAASNDSIMIMTETPPKEEITEADVERAWKRAENIDESSFELIDFIGAKYGAEKAVLSRDLNVYGMMTSPFGGDYGHKLVMSTIAPEEVLKLKDPVIAYNRKIIEHCAKNGVTIAMYGHDFCMNTGCMMSPQVIRDLYFPVMKEINNIIEANGMIPFFHCCGNTWDILDAYADAGYRGYQSIQQSAGVNWKAVKDKYYGRIALWTGVQCETLVNGTQEETELEVRTALEELMPGGGLIFGSTNSVQYGAKTENYLTALETLRKYGVYRK